MGKIDTYAKWLEMEGLPVIEDYSVFDLMAVPLKLWRRKGGFGTYINLTGSERNDDGYLCEIPPGGSLLPQKHLYEELIYILSGSGTTTVWTEGKAKESFEWQEGSLFSPPLNTWHQHFNARGDKPARYIAVTRAPVFMNLFHDLDFIFNNSYVFKHRYGGEKGYFSSQGKLIEDTVRDAVDVRPQIWDSNFITDCRTFTLVDDPGRGGHSTNVTFALSNSLMSCHISELPGGTYVKAHYHAAGAHLLCLRGQGYTLIWPAEGGIMAQGVKRIKLDWQKNSIVSPPDRWYHQHFSTGKEPARLLAFHAERSAKYKGIGKEYSRAKSVKLGGNAIDFVDEDPEIRRLFKEELAKTGTPWRMSQFFPGV